MVKKSFVQNKTNSMLISLLKVVSLDGPTLFAYTPNLEFSFESLMFALG